MRDGGKRSILLFLPEDLGKRTPRVETKKKGQGRKGGGEEGQENKSTRRRGVTKEEGGRKRLRKSCQKKSERRKGSGPSRKCTSELLVNSRLIHPAISNVPSPGQEPFPNLRTIEHPQRAN